MSDEMDAPTDVIAGLDAAISIKRAWCPGHRDGRDKPGHDITV
jgi:hypothetical protein